MTPDEHRERLDALRERLEEEMEEAPPNVLPQLIGQYRGTLDDLAKLESDKPQAGIQDDLKAKRAQRRREQKSA